MCVQVFRVVSVVWPIGCHDSFMVFNLWFGPGFIFEPCS